MKAYEVDAHQVNSMFRNGRKKDACALARNVLVAAMEDVNIGLIISIHYLESNLLASRSHLIVRLTRKGKLELHIDATLIDESFTNRLDAFKTICCLFNTDPLRTLREVSCIFDIEDGSNGGSYARVAFGSALSYALLVPDSYWVKYRGYKDLRVSINKHYKPWSERENIVFWRGSTTGLRKHNAASPEMADCWEWLPRLHLCAIAQASQLKEFDVGVSRIVQVPELDINNRIGKSGLMKRRVEKIDFINYRFLIDIDGNANAWDGLFGALLMGACVLKVQSHAGWREWYYDRLIAFEHYLPVHADLSNFVSQAQWAMSNAHISKIISEKARCFSCGMDYDEEMSSAGMRMGRLMRSVNITDEDWSVDSVVERSIAVISQASTWAEY